MAAANQYKFYIPLNMNGLEIKQVRLENTATDVTASADTLGRIWYNSEAGAIKVVVPGSTEGTYEVRTVALGSDLATAVTAPSAFTDGALLIGGDGNREASSYTTAGIVKVGADGAATAAVAGTDYLTADSTNTLTNKTFDANGTGNSISNLELADFASSAITTDLSTSAAATQLARADAVKAYVDSVVADLGTIVGAFDASAGTLPSSGSGASGAIEAGDYWRVSVAGDITGLGHLEVGDVLVASADGASTAADFFVIQGNITDAVTTSSSSSTDNALVRMDGTGGHTVQTSSATLDDSGNMVLPGTIKASQVNIDDSGNAVKVVSSYEASFSTTDFTGAAAPYTVSIAKATHGVDSPKIVQIVDSNGDIACATIAIDPSTEAVSISAMVKFAGVATIMGSAQ